MRVQAEGWWRFTHRTSKEPPQTPQRYEHQVSHERTAFMWGKGQGRRHSGEKRRVAACSVSLSHTCVRVCSSHLLPTTCFSFQKQQAKASFQLAGTQSDMKHKWGFVDPEVSSPPQDARVCTPPMSESSERMLLDPTVLTAL